MRLKGRVAIVTGAESGMGKATAERFASEGASLVLGYLKDPPEDLQASAKAGGGKVLAVQTDVRDPALLRKLVDTAHREFGHVDILFSNAGAVSWGLCEDIDDEELGRILDIDLKATIRLCHHILPLMKQRKYGRIIVNASISGPVMGWSGRTHYCAAKAGTVGFVRALALETGRSGITVNAIAPGTIESNMTRGRASHGSQALKNVAEAIPVGFVGQPKDVAAVAAFLASEECRFVTGQCIVVDGGFSIGPVFNIADENQPPPPGQVVM